MKIILNMYLKEKKLKKKEKKLLYSRLIKLIWFFYNFGNGNSK